MNASHLPASAIQRLHNRLHNLQDDLLIAQNRGDIEDASGIETLIADVMNTLAQTTTLADKPQPKSVFDPETPIDNGDSVADEPSDVDPENPVDNDADAWNEAYGNDPDLLDNDQTP